MKISDFLSPGDVMLDVRAKDKASLLRQLCTEAARKLGLNADEVAGQIAKREALGSTGLGSGLALPHARLKGLKSPFAILARLQHGIDFDAIDNEPVDIVFLLVLPDAANGDAQLNALACAARKLRDPKALQQIRDAADPKLLFEAIAAADPA
jgi:PTS system nitrogen regulatory IIA component